MPLLQGTLYKESSLISSPQTCRCLPCFQGLSFLFCIMWNTLLAVVRYLPFLFGLLVHNCTPPFQIIEVHGALSFPLLFGLLVTCRASSFPPLFGLSVMRLARFLFKLSVHVARCSMPSSRPSSLGCWGMRPSLPAPLLAVLPFLYSLYSSLTPLSVPLFFFPDIVDYATSASTTFALVIVIGDIALLPFSRFSYILANSSH